MPESASWIVLRSRQLHAADGALYCAVVGEVGADNHLFARLFCAPTGHVPWTLVLDLGKTYLSYYGEAALRRPTDKLVDLAFSDLCAQLSRHARQAARQAPRTMDFLVDTVQVDDERVVLTGFAPDTTEQVTMELKRCPRRGA